MEPILHVLGLCGDQHISVMMMISEWPLLSNVVTFIKSISKQYVYR